MKEKSELIVTGPYSIKKMVVHEPYVLSMKAKLAAELVTKWGVVSAKEDGEDSAGRSKLRLLSPKEVVERACEMSDLTYNQFHERGWLIETPPISDFADKERD